MDNLQNKNKLKKERMSNTSNESPFMTPDSSPIIEPMADSNNQTFKISTIEDQMSEQNFKNKSFNLDILILNLKIISKLKPGFKLSIKDNDCDINDVYIDTSYFQYFYRIFSDNSRDLTTRFLETLDKEINKKIEEIVKKENYNDSNMFLNSKENLLLNLSHNLNLSLVGLNNLINTYANDEYTISKIEMIINNFELKIRKISNILKVDK